jgi:hypothetical protein
MHAIQWSSHKNISTKSMLILHVMLYDVYLVHVLEFYQNCMCLLHVCISVTSA